MASYFRRTGRWISALLLVTGFSVSAAPDFTDTGGKPAADYLPAGTQFDPSVPTPESFLGSEVGTWHVRHDQLVSYMRALADASDRVSLEVTGHTHENRPLLLLTITAPENKGKLPEWRKQHLASVNDGAKTEKDAPLFLYMGYSIHGNEPSGSNASLVVAYYLAAATNNEMVSELLANNVVLFDPSFNPDGLSRFAQWANMHKGKNLNADGDNREHREGWPSGRPNHYWFDLNRDWLLLTHPESRARIAQFQKWRPHILTDHHEMGPDSTFFFQPGVPSRKNPNTPDGNVRLTEALAAFHAEAFDNAGQLYFSEEGFDDFYYGKGSSYPDSMGSIGILFEQASSRGHVQDTVNGELPFAQTIQNHVTASLSTMKGALATKPAILNYENSFFSETAAAIKDDDDFGAVIAVPDDHGRVEALLSILDQHGIEYGYSQKEAEAGEQRYPAGSIIVSYDQPKYRLIKSLFSTRQSFAENTFYDVSNWNIALAFDLDYDILTKREGRGLKTDSESAAASSIAIPAAAYAYAFEWNDYYSPALLQHLLEAGVMVKSAEAPFTAVLNDGSSHDFAAGTMIVPTALKQPDDLLAQLEDGAALSGVPVYGIKSGLTPKGSDLGGRTLSRVDAPRILLVGGEGTNSSEAGEIWHYLDTRVGLSPTIMEQDRLRYADLDNYSHIIFVSGSYGDLSESVTDAIGDWVKDGGVLIGQKTALRFFAQKGWLDAEIVSRDKVDGAFPTDKMHYADKAALRASKIIAGAVYETAIDPTHPIFFGYSDDILPVFKTTNMIVKAEKDPFTLPGHYTETPLLAGYSAKQLEDMIGNTASVLTQPKGRGVVIGFVDNNLFRGYWYGTGKLMSNAIYQSSHLTR